MTRFVLSVLVVWHGLTAVVAAYEVTAGTRFLAAGLVAVAFHLMITVTLTGIVRRWPR